MTDRNRSAGAKDSIPVRRAERLNLEKLAGPDDEPTGEVRETIPGLGVRDSRQWASLFGCDERTFRRWVRRYRIPHKKPGHVIYVAADDLWASLPYIT